MTNSLDRKKEVRHLGMSEVRKPRSDPPRRDENMARKQRFQIDESERIRSKMEDLRARSDEAFAGLELLGNEPVE